MPKTIITWRWEEAFTKYGFDDGNVSQTHVVEACLSSASYEVIETAGVHNYYIVELRKDGKGVWNIPDDVVDEPGVRQSLPPEVVALLDQEFPDDYELKYGE